MTPANFVVSYTIRCHICAKTDESLFYAPNRTDIPLPSLPPGWHCDPDVGNVCPDHKVEKAITVDGKPYAPQA